jgi:hypothetical protein
MDNLAKTKGANKAILTSKPYYFKYFNQVPCPFFEKLWSETLVDLQKDLTWIAKLEDEDQEQYSRDYQHDDFPTYYNWPQKWRDEFQLIKDKVHELTATYLSSAEKHDIDGNTLYIIGDKEVWFATQHYAHGDIAKVELNCNSSTDSVLTSAYMYMNDFKDWEKTHSKDYEAANILSSADSTFSDSLVNTNQECDGCGCITRIAKEDDNHNVFCSDCLK